jgi:hypothetical protein
VKRHVYHVQFGLIISIHFPSAFPCSFQGSASFSFHLLSISFGFSHCKRSAFGKNRHKQTLFIDSNDDEIKLPSCEYIFCCYFLCIITSEKLVASGTSRVTLHFECFINHSYSLLPSWKSLTTKLHKYISK